MSEERQWRDLVDTLPEPMTCPRRAENGMHIAGGPLRDSGPGLDRWEKFKSNGDRVCSYCGSLHWEDFKLMVKASAEGSEDDLECLRIEPSDKSYKIYVHRESVHNAHDGGIKFYTPHIDPPPTEEDNRLYGEAVRRSRARFNKWMEKQFPRRGSQASDAGEQG